jgi:protein-L-isoaspartate(D-aspartate) O-methyltransferase
MMDLDKARRAYAEELARLNDGIDRRIVDAFARVPREKFLSAGPWYVLGERSYQRTRDADPRHIYENVVVAIDPNREINNGEPSLHMRMLNALAVRAGDRVLHVGCGTGYYTAILAELAGPSGRITAVEFLPEFAARMRENLAACESVTVVGGDGTTHDPGPVDAIYVNAGVTEPALIWLERLAEGGRMLLMLTARDQWGLVLKIQREPTGFAAQFFGRCGFIPCVGARSPEIETALSEALLTSAGEDVRSLRLDAHRREANCWLHTDRYCLSRLPVPS